MTALRAIADGSSTERALEAAEQSLAYSRWTARSRLALAVVIAGVTIAGLLHSSDNIVGSALFLLVTAFSGSVEIWKLQGTHLIERDRRDEDSLQ